MIILTLNEWDNVKERITERHGLSMTLLSFKLKRDLGFTVRNHRYVEDRDLYRRHVHEIHLDFYDDAKETMFRLAYL